MALTYVKIADTVLTSNQNTITFSSINSTYTDLLLKWSARGTAIANTVNPFLRLNGQTSNIYSRTVVYATGTGGTGSGRTSNTDRIYMPAVPAANATANAFGNSELYLPSYTASQDKPVSIFTSTEYNSATVDENINLIAGLFRSTSAISSITITPFTGDFVSGSSFYLYGIKNA